MKVIALIDCDESELLEPLLKAVRRADKVCGESDQVLTICGASYTAVLIGTADEARNLYRWLARKEPGPYDSNHEVTLERWQLRGEVSRH